MSRNLGVPLPKDFILFTYGDFLLSYSILQGLSVTPSATIVLRGLLVNPAYAEGKINLVS